MNYIGSKYSLLDFLETTIEEVTGFHTGENRVFADPFAGTGIVGQTFRSKGYQVISNDIQRYSYVINKQGIEDTLDLYADEVRALLCELEALPPLEGFIYQNYCAGSGSGRNYFTDDNGKKCDAIRTELESRHSSGVISDEMYYLFLASLINAIDKCANTASVYGAFLKHIKKSASKQFSLELLPPTQGPIGQVYNEDVCSLITHISGDILYLDPPYNERQYAANYHVLETIARYDNPELTGVTGLRDYSDQKSKFCSKKTVVEEFDYLIRNADFKYIFLSYNNEGIMSLDTIREVMSKYGDYSVYTQDYRRFKADKDANRNIAAASTTEYLHCIIKNTKRGLL